MALQANMTTRPCLSNPVAARRSAANPARFSQLTGVTVKWTCRMVACCTDAMSSHRSCVIAPIPAYVLITARREVAVRGLPGPEDLIGRVNNPEVRKPDTLVGQQLMQDWHMQAGMLEGEPSPVEV